ncbi:tRNA uridine-5-carboxymethylaminomethyl(34) synthesis GTPase MnmE [Asticcacaulis endophyticus]|uniref:tRNA modification GTPase MnmE n=1 Tax=Asticcacaulis endophyticus TaxID=1395890 RepID=A0A918UP14_9CAUL|nr:tRNA uridine-5-carboxymethylaminomethyl(34) synthesis GTPase MnmE [Asticcacaulis endophyticus]GGZ23851.1 tRNA modification GTPase MnmE [Asticcacaulis endophyticus]
MKHTIFALASAQGRAGVSVIRISGPHAFEVVTALLGRLPKPRFASYGELTWQGDLIDKALVMVFKGPHSFTGEDCAEFHVHGSRAVMDRLYHIFNEMGLRHAEAGEFSRRAFENNKLDLTQAEAIADLVDAESEAQRRQALTQLDGGLKVQYRTWHGDLLKILAHIEALIDFPDEDIPQALADQVIGDIIRLKSELGQAITESKKGRQIREGFRIAILGQPNAGKSSLFNALLQTDAAIVTPIAGTTRDVIEAPIHIGAYSALIYDTAGLRETDDLVESEGIRRARVRGEQADLRIWVVDSSQALSSDWPQVQAGDYLILNKVDQSSADVRDAIKRKLSDLSLKIFETDLTTEQGVSNVRSALQNHLEQALSLSTFPAATRARHFERLRDIDLSLERALGIGFNVPELMAEDIRQAMSGFDALYGRTDVEQVLDHIFSSFCIGK